METRYVTLNARHRAVPRAREQVSGGEVLYETRVEYRAGLHTVPTGGGKVLDLAEYRRRMEKAEAPAESPAEELSRPEEVPSPTRRAPVWRERLTLALDAAATAALIAAAGGLLLAVWSWM